MIEAKTKFRQNCIQFLTKRSKEAHPKLEHKALSHLWSLLRFVHHQRLLFYIPFGFEVDVKPLIHKLRKYNSVYVPFMEGKSFKMVHYRLPLEKGKFGILQPKNSYKNIKKVEIMIVPVIGFDADFRRIGFGKGMYDRFFETLKIKPITIFIQLDACYCRQIIAQSHDIQANYLVSAKGIVKLKGNHHVNRIGIRSQYCDR